MRRVQCVQCVQCVLCVLCVRVRFPGTILWAPPLWLLALPSLLPRVHSDCADNECAAGVCTALFPGLALSLTAPGDYADVANVLLPGNGYTLCTAVRAAAPTRGGVLVDACNGVDFECVRLSLAAGTGRVVFEVVDAGGAGACRGVRVRWLHRRLPLARWLGAHAGARLADCAGHAEPCIVR